MLSVLLALFIAGGGWTALRQPTNSTTAPGFVFPTFGAFDPTITPAPDFLEAPTAAAAPVPSEVTPPTPMVGQVPAADGAASPAPRPSVAPNSPPSYLPALDTYISSDAPAANYADRDRIKIDRTPETWSLLRFDLPRGMRRRRALIRLYAQNTARHGGAVYSVPAEWDNRVTWQARPELGARLAEIGRVKKERWITVDVTGALQSSGVLSLAILPTSDQMASYYSAESNSSHAPQLIVER